MAEPYPKLSPTQFISVTRAASALTDGPVQWSAVLQLYRHHWNLSSPAEVSSRVSIPVSQIRFQVTPLTLYTL